VFDEVLHRYTIDGKILPSVSEIMKPLSEQYYSNVDKNVLRNAAYRGTRIHKAIEMFHQFGIETDEQDIKPYLLGYKMAYMLEGYEPVYNEIMLTNNEYCGTIDMIAKRGDEIIIIDLKATSKINFELIEVQLAGYQELVKHVGMDCKTYVLHVKKGAYKFIEIEPNYNMWEDLKRQWQNDTK
jgi:hypothetical protein